MRKVHSVTSGNAVATIYRDPDWEEYCVKLKVAGVHLSAADYHTGDYEDAQATATTMAQNAGSREALDAAQQA